MLTAVYKQSKTSLLMLGVLSVITGILYPVLVTIFAQTLFPWQANGSLLKQQDKVVGSLLIGQEFKQDHYFWGRPSATQPMPYNAMASGGSNLGASNPELLKLVKQRAAELHRANPDIKISMPIDLITASASGLDPDIGIRAAFYQLPRIAKARKIDVKIIQDLIMQQSNDPMQLFSRKHVNVLQLNLALDNISATRPSK